MVLRVFYFCGIITVFIGRPYLIANSKSLWSWAGTLIIAPVPYSINTKLAIHTGSFSPLMGFNAYFPVKIPSLISGSR